MSRRYGKNDDKRMIQILRLAAELGSVRRAAHQLGVKNETLITRAADAAMAISNAQMINGTYVSYNHSCRVAADIMENP